MQVCCLMTQSALQAAATQAGMSEGECALLIEPWTADSSSTGLALKVSLSGSHCQLHVGLQHMLGQGDV